MNRLYFNANVKSLKEGEFEVVASNAKIDRFGDTINPDGWVLTNYKKNPVILWSHSTGGFGEAAVPPVARATKVRVEDGQLKVKGIFAPTPFAQELRTLVENNFLNAVSVGFLPLVEDTKGDMEIDHKMYRRANEEELKSFEKGHMEGTKFMKQELLEVSWVNVPALPSALVSARKMGLALITKELTKAVGKPYPNEHSCRLKPPGDYKTCRRTSRTSDGKKYDILTCQRKDDSTKWEEQAFRYPKDTWTAPEARSHCSEHDGTFEPASEEGLEEIETKEGRVLSEKNRKLIGEAISALKALLEATEPNSEPDKSITPIIKGRSHDKAKGGVIPELRLMRLADKAVENVLRDLKKKPGRKVEVRLLRIASKLVDTVLINAKRQNDKTRYTRNSRDPNRTRDPRNSRDPRRR